MIFVTVGTHEQQFNRLVECIDRLKRDNIIQEDVVIQTGYSSYIPENCEWKDFYPYSDMLDFVEKARIVITHGGPSSFIMALQIKKVPVVVPRQKEFSEHVNNHQLLFCKEIENRYNNMICVTDINDLENVIRNYDSIVDDMKNSVTNNNENFCLKFEEIVNKLFR